MSRSDKASDEELGAEYEKSHVHEVYEQIASHFSSTRYKPWPFISKFLASLPDGSIGLDVGAGNGKYLNINPSLYIIASDRSPSLINIASLPLSASKDALVADILGLPHPNGRFDFVISIAVIHHLSTRQRRVAAIKMLLDLLKKNEEAETNASESKVLIYVWALEQKNSRRGWDTGQEQDVMVPWLMKGQHNESSDNSNPKAKDQTFLRYYHLYREGELEQDVIDAGGRSIDSGYEKDNWWAIASPKP